MRYATVLMVMTSEINMATTSVRLDQDLVEKASIIGKALNRTTPKQIEHWAKIGGIMEDNPDLPYEFVKQAVISQAQKEAGKMEPYNFG
jgi:sensor domain CHASE-containing protein